MKTYYKVICSNCGNEGDIVLRENDQPYSEMYESWSLKNISGILHSEGEWEEVFLKSDLRCAKCNTRLTVKDLKQ